MSITLFLYIPSETPSADAAIGLLYAEELILHKIGAGLAAAMGLGKKHTTKQIDRLLTTKNLIFGRKVVFGLLI